MLSLKQLQEDLANARTVSFADDEGSRTMTHEDISALMAGIAPVLHAHVKAATAPLLARIVELEARPQLKYLGVWREGRKYSEGSCATHDGGIWIALKSTTDRPSGSADWQLAVKSGR